MKDYQEFLKMKSAEASPFQGLADFLRSVANASRGKWDPRLNEFSGPIVVKAMGEGVGASGGFLVPVQHVSQLLAKSLEASVILSKCFIIPMTSDTVEIPAIDETTRADGTVHGGISLSWTPESGTITPTQPKVAKVHLQAKKLTGLCRLSNELLEDSAPSAEAVIGRLFSEALAFFRDDYFVVGTGAGQPLGVMNAACLITVSKKGGQAAKTILFDNLVAMFERLPDESKQRAVWFINGECFSQILGICQTVGTGGGSAFLGAWTQGAVGPVPQTIFGRPIVWTEHCAALGTVGDVLLADFSQYIVGDRVSLAVDVSREIYFTTDETAFRIKARLDGQPWWAAALTPKRGTNTRSPFVVLEARG